MTGNRPARHPRQIVRLFADDPMVRVPGPVGITSDESLSNLYAYLAEAERNAWLMFKAGKLPDQWRLCAEIRAEGFSKGHDMMTYPQIDAAAHWAGLTIEEQTYESEGWRLAKTGPYAGSPVRVQLHHVTGALVQGERREDVSGIVLPDPAVYDGVMPLPQHR